MVSISFHNALPRWTLSLPPGAGGANGYTPRVLETRGSSYIDQEEGDYRLTGVPQPQLPPTERRRLGVAESPPLHALAVRHVYERRNEWVATGGGNRRVCPFFRCEQPISIIHPRIHSP